MIYGKENLTMPYDRSALQEVIDRLKSDIKTHSEIQGDKDQVKQIFINLIKNAEEAIDQLGEIVITGTTIDQHYEIRIKDTGKGIAENNLNSIFDLHFTTKKEGSGIGLSVVQQIVSAHHGNILVESEENQGTTIILQFPLENTSIGV